YVLFNNNLLPAGVHDISVENLYGDEPYTVEAVGSASLPIPIGGNYGPYTMPITDMLHLYNIYLEQDTYAFRLDNLAAAVDWGFALHPHDIPYQGRHNAMIGGAAYMAGPGDPEWFTVDVPVAGYYGLAVFKARPSGFDIEGEYRLTILQGVSDVPDEEDLPVATALAGVHPNPFNPQTTISYELAAAAVVALEIYDVKGALVRCLVNESMPAGRHAVVWNGEDDSGARVASGVYLARFTAGAHRVVRKVVMVK
ncbi:MAG: FlgD immunoglobulin-like domain containing protein, partial [Candidatus Krumholzibacteriota bacterium]